MNFKQKFYELSKAKNSLLVAGVDTATREMKNSLSYPQVEKKLQFSLDFIEAVADFCIGIKINLAYWQDKKDGGALVELAKLCRKKELLFLLDAKYSDIGSTQNRISISCLKFGLGSYKAIRLLLCTKQQPNIYKIVKFYVQEF